MSRTSLDRDSVDDGLAAALGPGGLSRDERARTSGYRSRFTAVYVALGVLAGVAVAALAVVGLGDDAPTTSELTQAWGEFVPTGSTDAVAREIADRVSERYVYGTPPEELTGVIAGPLTVTSNQPEGSTQVLVRAVAVRPTLPAGGEADAPGIDTVDTTTAVQYMLCGFGRGCSIAKGQPSEDRALLLRREALELGLYTFRYMPRVESIVVYMPPPYVDGQQAAASTAVYLRRDDVALYLTRALDETLSPVTPEIGQMTPAEIETVERLIRPRLYRFEYTQAQDGGVVMLLDPVTNST